MTDYFLLDKILPTKIEIKKQVLYSHLRHPAYQINF